MEEKTKIPVEKIKGGLYKLLSDLFKVLSNTTRMEILDLLYPHSDRATLTFSGIMFTVRKNPSTITHHLDMLREYNLLEKVKGGYRITDLGVFALQADVAHLIGITEKAIETGKAKGYVVSKD